MINGSYRIKEKDGLFFCQHLTLNVFDLKRSWKNVKNIYGYVNKDVAVSELKKYIKRKESELTDSEIENGIDVYLGKYKKSQ
jgi:hypothetical protein